MRAPWSFAEFCRAWRSPRTLHNCTDTIHLFDAFLELPGLGFLEFSFPDNEEAVGLWAFLVDNLSFFCPAPKHLIFDVF
jgi:hypothetical protein